jgi:polyketide synthase 12
VSRPLTVSAAVVERWICDRVAEVTGRAGGDVDPDSTFAEHGLNSVDLVSLAGELEDRFAVPVPDSAAYDWPSPARLAVALTSTGPALAPAGTGERRAGDSGDPVGIVGMSCRFPGGSDPDRFWQALLAGRDAVTTVPPDRWDVDAHFDPDPRARGASYTRSGAFLPDVAAWDADFFGVSPQEARRTDPRHRLLMELVWEALEDAGIAPTDLAGTRTAVYVGLMDSGHYARLQQDREGRDCLADPHFPVGAAGSVAAGRIAHWLDLRGPALTVDTACSPRWSRSTWPHRACNAARSTWPSRQGCR